MCTYLSQLPPDQVNQLSRSPESGNLPHRQFEEHLLVAHYLATRAACGSLKQLEKILTKLSVSLLRYTATVPADKAFYEAGLHCRVRMHTCMHVYLPTSMYAL